MFSKSSRSASRLSRFLMEFKDAEIDSDILFAARPVGAASMGWFANPSRLSNRRRHTVIAVFPVPGPPESRRSDEWAAEKSAKNCSGLRLSAFSLKRTGCLRRMSSSTWKSRFSSGTRIGALAFLRIRDFVESSNCQDFRK